MHQTLERLAEHTPAIQQSTPTTPADGFLPAKQVLARYSISEQTIWRWLRDESLGFPKPMVVNRRRFWKLSGLEAWEAARAAA